METSAAIEIVRRALVETFWVGCPLLAIAFLAGAAMSLIQILTSIQDASFGTFPKLAALVAGLLLFLPWMTIRMLVYTTTLLGDFTRYAH